MPRIPAPRAATSKKTSTPLSEAESAARTFAAEGRNVDAAAHFREAALIAENQQADILHIVQLWRDSAEHYYHAFLFVDSLKALDHALRCVRLVNAPREECLIRLQYAHVLQNTGDMQSSIEEIQAAYRIAEQMQDLTLTMRVKLLWGNYYRHREQPELALEQYLPVLGFHERAGDKLSVAGTSLNIGTIYELQKEAVPAEEFYRKCIALCAEIGEHVLMVKAQFFLGAMLEGSGVQPEEGLRLLYQALEASIRLSLVYEEFSIRMQLADIYERGGDDARAAEEFLTAKSLSTGSAPLHDMRVILRRLTQIEERRGNITQAYQYLTHYLEVTNAYEQEIRERRALEFEVQLHRMEEKRANELLQKELRSKQRLQEAAAFHAREREQFHDSLQKRLDSIAATVSKKSQKLIENLQKEIKNSTTSGKEWAEFEQGFLDAHSELEQKLTLQFPALTATERKVCILLRAGRSTKEIGRLLHISPDTADTHRARIRKKLQLPTGASIAATLAAL